MQSFKLLLQIFFIILILAASTLSVAKIDTKHKKDVLFYKLADDYFDHCYLPNNPTIATELGIHRYDSLLEDYSLAGINKQIAQLKEYEWNFNEFNPLPLSEYARADRELVLNSIRSQLLNLETIKPWENNPDFYSSGISNSAFVVMERPYASAATRLRVLIAREKLMPKVLQEARVNLKKASRKYTQIALEQLPDIITFFNKDLPAAFDSVKDKALQKEFVLANHEVVQALKNYQAWLKISELPHAKGDYRIGAATFHRKLQYDEMIDTPLDKLLKIGLADLHKNQKALVKIIHEINPHQPVHQVLNQINATHPAADKLLKTFQTSLDELAQFIKTKNIMSLPSLTKPLLQETPAFMRATTFAAMDTPGPFENKPLPSYFNVTLPNSNWTHAHVADFMKSYSRPTILSAAIHEVYPGHFMQYLWMKKIHGRVRKILSANTNVEGWAHYVEQMMYDEGYDHYAASDARGAKMLRVGQLLDALLRDARFVVAIKMHTGKMSFNQAVDFFVKEGYQTHSLALIETKRATIDPTYLYYTLGKLQIMKLRHDVATKEGKDFSLAKFHNTFMLQGFPPIKVIRKAMLHDDTPTL